MKIAKQLNVGIILVRKVVAQFSLEGLLIPCTTADAASTYAAGQGTDGAVASAEAGAVAPALAPAVLEPDRSAAAAAGEHTGDRAAKRSQPSETPLATRAQRDIAGVADAEYESDEHDGDPPRRGWERIEEAG
jgi:hypothetical protein